VYITLALMRTFWNQGRLRVHF